MNTLTEERIRELLLNSFIIGREPDGFANLLKSANADPEEGAEWLPYYKLALALLMQAFGTACAVAQDAISTPNPTPAKTYSQKRMMRLIAYRLAELSNHVCGIGPGPAPTQLLPLARLPEFPE
jgi:hypothetical protein